MVEQIKKGITFLRAVLMALLLCFYVTGEAVAQDIFYKKFTSEDGLPSSMLYRVRTDSKGFLWITSNAGITRFDGTTFKHFSVADGLPDNEVFDACEDRQGRIWFTTLKGVSGYILNEKITVYKRIPELNQLKIHTVFCDSKGQIWFSTLDGQIFCTHNDAIIRKWKSPYNYASWFVEDKLGTIWFTTFRTDRIYYIQEDQISYVQVLPEQENYFYSHRPKLLKNGMISFYGRSHWGLINPTNKTSRIHYQVPESTAPLILASQEGLDKTIWVATMHGVIILEPSEDSYRVKREILYNEKVSSITRDFEGNFWASTLGEGLNFIPANMVDIITFSNQPYANNMTTLLPLKNGTIWCGSNDGPLYSIKGNRGRKEIIDPSITGVGRVTCGIEHQDGSLWFGKDDGILIVDASKKIKKLPFGAIKTMAEAGPNQVWIGDNNHIRLIDAQRGQLELIKTGRIGFMARNGDHLLFANENGLYKLQDGVIRLVLDGSYVDEQRITGAYVDTRRNILWICTSGNGIFGFRDNTVFYHFTSKNGLPSDVCSHLFADDNGDVWVSTKKGIVHIKIEQSATPFIQIFNTSNGLVSEEVNSVYVNTDTVWAATNRGVCIFRRNAIKNNPIAPKIYIGSFLANGESQINQSPLSLKFNQNTIRIQMVGISYQSGRFINYKYKLEGLDTSWIVTSNPTVNFNALQPGTYRFLAKSINQNGLESERVAEVRFIIHPAYWQTNWFKTFIGFISFLLILSIIIIRIKVIKTREEEKTKFNQTLNELKLTALKAQMNPHFLFNSLGSIQNLINTDRKKEANIYLSKFAKLLRTILDNSDKKEVTLADKIQLLELYLTLESLRFSGQFEYAIEIPRDVDIYAIKIPPMIIQPFVENAIKHGLVPKKGDARLQIRFEVRENKVLYCMIQDNGIGRLLRERLKEGSSTDHESKGIRITSDRLKLINELRRRPAEFTITDLYDSNGEAAGTRVEVVIPFD